jgi:hypothetical protein
MTDTDTVRTSENQKPVGHFMSVVEWDRSLDPWHADAFPDELKHAGTTGERKAGWMGYDWCGNPIVFIPDGTEVKDAS